MASLEVGGKTTTPDPNEFRAPLTAAEADRLVSELREQASHLEKEANRATGPEAEKLLAKAEDLRKAADDLRKEIPALAASSPLARADVCRGAVTLEPQKDGYQDRAFNACMDALEQGDLRRAPAVRLHEPVSKITGIDKERLGKK